MQQTAAGEESGQEELNKLWSGGKTSSPPTLGSRAPCEQADSTALGVSRCPEPIPPQQSSNSWRGAQQRPVPSSYQESVPVPLPGWGGERPRAGRAKQRKH